MAFNALYIRPDMIQRIPAYTLERYSFIYSLYGDSIIPYIPSLTAIHTKPTAHNELQLEPHLIKSILNQTRLKISLGVLESPLAVKNELDSLRQMLLKTPSKVYALELLCCLLNIHLIFISNVIVLLFN